MSAPLSSLAEIDGTLAVLESMFPPPELVLRIGVDLPLAEATPGTLPAELRAILTLTLDGDDVGGLGSAGGGNSSGRELVLDLVFPLLGADGQPSLVLRPPTWLSHAQFRELLDGLPASSTGGGPVEGFVDVVLESADHLRQAVPALLARAASHLAQLEADRLARQADSNPEAERWPSAADGNGGGGSNVDRVWYWLPSLSTREKRNDIVRAAPGWSLTGFVLAGKPGIICVEGTERNVDGYMNWIKAVSWSDIPSFQKVTERHREGSIPRRLFTGMQEITDLISFGGHRGNRGEMGEVRRWIEGHQVDRAVLGHVLNLGGT